MPRWFQTLRVDPGPGGLRGRLGFSTTLVSNSNLTNLGFGVIRPSQSLALSLFGDRITLNHLHSGGGGVITFSAGCNHKPHVDVGNALRMEAQRQELCCWCEKSITFSHPRCRRVSLNLGDVRIIKITHSLSLIQDYNCEINQCLS